MAETQTYAVHLRTGAGVKEVLIRSDSPPQFPSTHNDLIPGGFIQIGEGYFQTGEVLAVVPRPDRASSGAHSWR